MIRGSLEWLLAPTDPTAFLAHHFEKKALHVHGDVRRFRGLPTLADVDRALTRREILHPAARMARNGSLISPDSFTRHDDVADAVLVAERIAEGATLILDGVQKWSAPVAHLCRVLGRRITGEAWANLYLTPRGSHGFAAHADDHDVFVLQLAGEKRWSLHAPPAEFPSLAPIATGALTVGTPIETLTLGPGDVLYVPRGHAHAALTHESDSIHLTIGITPATWVMVLRAALEGFAARDERLRHAVPIGAFQAPSAVRAELAAMLGDFAAGVDAGRALRDLHAEVARGRRAHAPGHVAAALERTPVTPDTVVVRTPGLDVARRTVGRNLEISLPGRTITLPRYARAAVRFALAGQRFRVKDLPDDLDDDGKLVLVKRLVREGVLRVLPRGRGI